MVNPTDAAAARAAAENAERDLQEKAAGRAGEQILRAKQVLEGLHISATSETTLVVARIIAINEAGLRAQAR